MCGAVECFKDPPTDPPLHTKLVHACKPLQNPVLPLPSPHLLYDTLLNDGLLNDGLLNDGLLNDGLLNDGLLNDGLLKSPA